MGRNKNIPAIDDDVRQVDEDVLIIEEERINYDLDEEFENNGDLIQYEFNMIELPFFTKDKRVEDTKARRYVFSERNDSYMRIIPSGDQNAHSNKIPQEFDEKVFYGILKLSREQKRREVITDYFTLAQYAHIHYKNLRRIKDSLERLNDCKIETKNLFYSVAIRNKIDGKQEFSILQSKDVYTFKQVQKFPEEMQEKYRKYFRNSKITEILVLSLSEKIYQNIQKKGYLYFDQKHLLKVQNPTARKIYLMITKWYGWEKKSVITRSCRFLASRIPLSWENASVSSTIKTIGKACDKLVAHGLLQDYTIVKKQPIKRSYIEFAIRDEKHDKITAYAKRASQKTGHEDIEIMTVEDEIIDSVSREHMQPTLFNADTEDHYDELVALLPDTHRTKQNRSIIKDALVFRSVAYITSNIVYTKKNAKNFSAMFPRAMEKDYGEHTRIQKQTEETKQHIKQEKHRRAEQHQKDLAEKQYAIAEERYMELTVAALKNMEQKAENSMQYEIQLAQRVQNGEMDKATALKKVILTKLMPRVDEL